MRERVTVTLKEEARVKVLTMVIEGRCESAEAAQLLQMSVRHLLRLKRAFREEGPAAVAHGNRGRRPGHAIQEELRRKMPWRSPALWRRWASPSSSLTHRRPRAAWSAAGERCRTVSGTSCARRTHQPGGGPT